MTVDEPVRIVQPDGAVVDGDLALPEGTPESTAALVVFAHGSGSSRRSPRNRQVAASLRARGLGTLLMDLLTADEDAVDLRTRQLRFDIDLLATRLVSAAEWLSGQPELEQLPLGYFGASTGAAAALVAAARRPEGVAAVVSRGGRPDLAGDHLQQVRAATLLIVGGHDTTVLRLNRQAYGLLQVERRLDVVPGATHLFEEPGAMDEVARLAGDWFADHLITT